MRYVTSFEMETGTTVENYAIRTKNGFALPNGQAVSGGEKDSFWFGDYCAGNGNCKNTNKSLITIALSDLKEGDLQGGFPTPPPRQMAGDDDTNSDFGGESELPEDFAPFQPTYCVAVGGDTAPLVEVGLEYIQGEGKRGSLAFQRIDVSGYRDSELAGLPSNCFKDGNLCLDLLAETNPALAGPMYRSGLWVRTSVLPMKAQAPSPHRAAVARVFPDHGSAVLSASVTVYYRLRGF